MEAIILKISWHYWTMKIRKNRQTKHVEKKLIISNDNHNSNNNDLRDRQNHRLEKKWTLIWITNWLGLLRVWRIQALHDKQFKTTAGRKEKKKLKTMRYITPAMGYYPRNGQMGGIDPRSDM